MKSKWKGTFENRNMITHQHESRTIFYKAEALAKEMYQAYAKEIYCKAPHLSWAGLNRDLKHRFKRIAWIAAAKRALEILEIESNEPPR